MTLVLVFLLSVETMEVSGTMRARTLEITRHTFQYGATSEIWIPFEHTGESNNPDWENQFVTAFAGELKRILVRPENTQNGKHLSKCLVLHPTPWLKLMAVLGYQRLSEQMPPTIQQQQLTLLVLITLRRAILWVFQLHLVLIPVK